MIWCEAADVSTLLEISDGVIKLVSRILKDDGFEMVGSKDTACEEIAWMEDAKSPFPEETTTGIDPIEFRPVAWTAPFGRMFDVTESACKDPRVSELTGRF